MEYTDKLMLTLKGYSPNEIGILTYALNHKFNITEEQVKNIFQIDETFLAKHGPIKQGQTWQAQQAVDAIIKSFGHIAPAYRVALPKVLEVLKEINFPGMIGDQGQINTKYADRLTKYIIHNWNELTSHREPQVDYGNKSGEELEARLKKVPWLKKPTGNPRDSLKAHPEDHENIPQS